MSPAREWRLPAPVAGFPASIPFEVKHYGPAWDYCGPTWDHTERQKSGGVWANFYADGTQTYMGADRCAAYRLSDS